MSYINVPLGDDVQEQQAVDEGTYSLVIAWVGEEPSKAGKPMITVGHEIEGHPEAAMVYHYLPLPSDEDEEKARSFKTLNLKRYLTLAGIDFEADGFNVEDLYGAQFDGFLTKEQIDSDDENAPPEFRNVLQVPRLSS